MEKMIGSVENYDDFYSKTDWKQRPFYTHLYIKSFLNIIQTAYKKEIRSIMDIGCGTGIYTFVLSKEGYETTGIDYSRIAIEKAKKEFPELDFEWQDATRIEFRKEYDLLFVKGLTLFNTTDYEKVQRLVSSWKYGLSKNGIIAIQSRTDFSQKSPTNWYYHNFSEIERMYRVQDFDIKIIFMYSKLQYIFLIPFPGKLLPKIISWISQKVLIGILKKPVNYFVLLNKKEDSL